MKICFEEEIMEREEYRTKFDSEIHNYLETPSAENYLSDGLKDYFQKIYPPEDRYTVLKGIEKQVLEGSKGLKQPGTDLNDLSKNERKEYFEKESNRICEQYPEETFLKLHEHGREMVADMTFDRALAEAHRIENQNHKEPSEDIKQHEYDIRDSLSQTYGTFKEFVKRGEGNYIGITCLLYTSPSPRD